MSSASAAETLDRGVEGMEAGAASPLRCLAGRRAGKPVRAN